MCSAVCQSLSNVRTYLISCQISVLSTPTILIGLSKINLLGRLIMRPVLVSKASKIYFNDITNNFNDFKPMNDFKILSVSNNNKGNNIISKPSSHNNNSHTNNTSYYNYRISCLDPSK